MAPPDMSEEETKNFFNGLQRLLSKDQQTTGCRGIKRPACRLCGGSIHETSGGVRRMMCSKCGEPYHQPRFA